MKVYIAGPMTGYPLYNALAFDQAKMVWQLAGWEAVTPLDTNSIVWERHYGQPFNPANDKCDYGDPLLGEMLLEDFRALIEADAIAMLPGWQKSKGATLEHRLALNLDKPIYSATTRKPLEPVAETVCQEADRLVSGDRGAAYGHPFDDYTKTGTIWGALLHGWAKEAAAFEAPIAVPPDLAILCMIGVKLSREVHIGKRDNMTDTAGYAKCLAMVRERQIEKGLRDKW